jgi:hypothetical protein
MQPVMWQGHEYFTSQYFHQQYLAQSPYGAKHQLHRNFLRLLRSIPAYATYVSQGDVVELAWNRIKTEATQILSQYQPLFEGTGYQPLTLLNATAQVAMTHHLDDELSQQISVAANTATARQLTKKAGVGLPDEIAARKLAAWQEMGRLLGTPAHIVQQEAAKQIAATTGINLRPLLLAAPAQDAITPDDKMLEPRDLAKALGLSSGRILNSHLESLGWQVKRIGGGWEATPAGALHSTQHAWIADHGAKSGYNLKWNCEAVRTALIARGVIAS